MKTTPHPTTETRTCPYCNTTFYYEKGPGRPPIYCTDTCRKYAAAHRKYAHETKSPLRLIYAQPLTPEPKPRPVHRTLKLGKKELKDFLRSEPATVIPELTRQLGYCLNDRKIPREERAQIAKILGKTLTQLARAEYGFVGGESAKVPVTSGISPQEFVQYAQVLGAFEDLAAWVHSAHQHTEYERAVAIGKEVLKAKREVAGEVEQLRAQVKKLEKTVSEQQGQLEQAYATIARVQEHEVQARGRSFIAAGEVMKARERVAELESLMTKWQKHAEDWERVAKMERARAAQEVVRVRAEVLGGGSAFFRGK